MTQRSGHARQVGRQVLSDAVDEIFLLRIAANISEGQNDDGKARRDVFLRAWDWRRLRLLRLADFERINADWLGDVLELGGAKIVNREIETALYLTVGVLGETDGAGLGDALKPRSDIHAVAHQIAVRLLDHVAKVDAYAELDAAFGRQAGVSLDHAGLHFDRVAHSVHYAAELDDRAVASPLDDAPMMRGDGRIDQIAAQTPQPRQSTILVSSGEPAVADNIGDQDRSDLPRFRHGASSRASFTIAQG